MDCPKCGGEFQPRQHKNISVDWCDGCEGLLVKELDLMRLLKADETDTLLDIGDPSRGKKFDRVDDINCPVCNIEMERIVDPEQTHIWLESCNKCTRVFLDAGEFTDLKHLTFSDKFKALLKGKREER